MTKINAEIVADSLSPQGDRLTSLLITFPRFILAEVNTHRMLSKNTSSSRAIPFNKMVETVENNPFIPIAWQKEHKGMQGSEYITNDIFIREAESNWLVARNKAIESAKYLNATCQVTKQLCNRLLEPFMWTTMLITGSKEGWNNFFNLRCPSYNIPFMKTKENIVIEEGYDIFKSKKDAAKRMNVNINIYNELEWLKLNKGQAEIHIMDLAEKMWDAMNESTPKQLEVGQWHIPFGDNIKEHLLLESFGLLTPTEIEEIKVKIAVARCARLSYETLGDNPVIDYRKDIALHNTLLAVKHMSPFEHCAVVMENEEYYSHIKGNIETQIVNVFEERRTTPIDKDSNVFGWSRNLKGFKQYREIIEYGK